MKRRLLVALLAAALLPTAACAWGPEGHRLVAELADARLEPKTRENVAALLAFEPGATLASIASWADENRTRETAAWHYVNFPRDADCTYRAGRDCRNGDCVVAALEAQAQVLASNAPPDAKLLALKYVVHFVGDVHQPLHAAFGDDRGGNLYQVQADGQGTNPHAVWDSWVIHRWPGGHAALRKAIDGLPAATQATPIEWGHESCRIATAEGFYPVKRTLGVDYAQSMAPTVASRLRAAADRLAGLLTALSAPPASRRKKSSGTAASTRMEPA